MVEVGGRPLLEWTFAWLLAHGVTEVAVNLHYRPETIRDHFGDGRGHGLQLRYSHEETLLGSAGAAKRLEGWLGEPFLVIYGDVLTDLDLGSLLRRHRETGAAATLAVAEVDDVTRAGIVEVDGEGRVREFREKPRPEEVSSRLANAGVYVLQQRVLREVPIDRASDFGYNVFPALLGAGEPLVAWPVVGYLMDIGEPERLEQARRDAAEQRILLASPVAGGARGPAVEASTC
jgi:NDP-sugar pyrophosphorylase family protein